jgi:hypothetical protein
MSAPSSQPVQNNAYPPSLTGMRQAAAPQVNSGYNQTTIPPPLPGTSQYPRPQGPSITARPQGSDVDNILVPQMANIGINQNSNQFDVMYLIRPNLLIV